MITQFKVLSIVESDRSPEVVDEYHILQTLGKPDKSTLTNEHVKRYFQKVLTEIKNTTTDHRNK